MKSFSRLIADRIKEASRKQCSVPQTAKLSSFAEVTYVPARRSQKAGKVAERAA